MAFLFDDGWTGKDIFIYGSNEVWGGGGGVWIEVVCQVLTVGFVVNYVCRC